MYCDPLLPSMAAAELGSRASGGEPRWTALKMRRDTNGLITRIDVSRRLRRAVLLNDLLLVQRIVRANPGCIRNPDFEDRHNTSLHLAAKHGFMEIAVG